MGNIEVMGEGVSYRVVRKGFTETTLKIPEESERPSHVVIWRVTQSGRGHNKCRDLGYRLLRVIGKIDPGAQGRLRVRREQGSRRRKAMMPMAWQTSLQSQTEGIRHRHPLACPPAAPSSSPPKAATRLPFARARSRRG